MELGQIENAAKLASARIPFEWRADCTQEIICQALELETKGAPLTPANVSAIAVQVVDYAFRHWIHDQHGRERLRTVSLDTIVQTVDGESVTLADCLPNPHYINRVEDYTMARLALQSMPPAVAKVAAMALIDKAHLPKGARQMLKAWAVKEGIAY